MVPDSPSLAAWSRNYAAMHSRRLAVDLALVEQYVSRDSRIVEFGCIPPLLTAALQRIGYDVSGVDIDPSRYASSIKCLNINVTACDIERDPLPWPECTFDAALFNELFEHLRINPIATMREVYRVLRPGGRLLMSTPNFRSFKGIMNLLRRASTYNPDDGIFEQYAKLDTLGHMGHVREYTAPDVTRFLTRIGFDVERVVYRAELLAAHDYAGRLAAALRPSLRPYMSVIARRPAQVDRFGRRAKKLSRRVASLFSTERNCAQPDPVMLLTTAGELHQRALSDSVRPNTVPVAVWRPRSV